MSMVVADLNLAGISPLPTKANPPLVVNPYGVSTRAVALESLEPVAGRNPEIGKLSGGIELNKLAKGNAGDSGEAHA